MKFGNVAAGSSQSVSRIANFAHFESQGMSHTYDVMTVMNNDVIVIIQIRYEGILYAIDTDAMTVALTKVRSFGTENRCPDRPIGPRDETFGQFYSDYDVISL